MQADASNSPVGQPSNNSVDVKQDPGHQTAMVAYILLAAGFVFGITFIIGGIIGLIKKDESGYGEFSKKHFEFIWRTFLFSAIWSVVGLITSFIFIGYVVLVGNFIWTLYRVIKGMLKFFDDKTV
ncbi:DUF4870 family protein [Parendozoicomonas haliclonae]|uniref:Transmembrane protein n=1 Tax=Parendozoicomonas haliclonae TaxID=1960125 RepID=A0A1X7AFH0_9GAMM|nr:hypothetical protein [Parendozoicomonas haliclonae]SMA37585.1 hypothetical protein EHSB41UT_00762 [Parendozoicomonas haliclonae]